jgi:uncharacterized protein (TIGR02217 family)
MSFHEIRLPVDVERGAVGGPGFKTTVTPLASGHEQRNGDWLYARGNYDISYGITTKETFRDVLQFFYARRGRLFGFRFKDWSDFQGTDEAIGTGDGAQTQFQLSRTYTDAGNSYVRPIVKPVENTITVALDGTPTTAFTADTTTGVITMDAAPANGVAVTASFEFDVPVRFEEDSLDVRLQWEDAGSVPAIGLVELRQQLATLS